MFERNAGSSEDDLIPENLLEVQSPDLLDKWIARFVAEARQSNGKEYSPRSLHQILCGLLRYMRSVKDDAPNILEKSDARFPQNV